MLIDAVKSREDLACNVGCCRCSSRQSAPHQLIRGTNNLSSVLHARYACLRFSNAYGPIGSPVSVTSVASELSLASLGSFASLASDMSVVSEWSHRGHRQPTRPNVREERSAAVPRFVISLYETPSAEPDAEIDNHFIINFYYSTKPCQQKLMRSLRNL